MAILDINWQPPTRQLRQFGLIFLPVFALLVGWWLRRQGFSTPVWLALPAVAALVALVTAIQPQWVRPLFVGWMVLAFPIGWVVSHVILGLIFFVLFTLVGRLMALVGYDPMRRKPDPAASTYFEPVVRNTDSGQYFKQF